MNWGVVYKVISRANSKYPFYEEKFSYADYTSFDDILHIYLK